MVKGISTTITQDVQFEMNWSRILPLQL